VFPTVPVAAWDAYRSLYASGFDGDNLSLNIGSYLILGGGRTMLVDTGLGPQTRPDNPGHLADNLIAEGVNPGHVDTVIFTHLHVDHVGWNFQDGKTTFPAASYVVQQSDWDFFSAQKEDASVKVQVLPLQATGALQLVSGEVQLTDSITLLPTPGHTPGHQSILVSSGGEQAIITGDIAHHPAQVQETDWCPGFDNDVTQSAVTRAAFMQRLQDEGLRACFGHFPAPGFGTVVRENGRRSFRAL
jgi:glyoxylase-like metal-dependent hydrolase (beta-lactamase superfamily II)